MAAPSPHKKRVLLAASSGGHLRELLALPGLYARHDTLLVTEQTPYRAQIPAGRVCYVPQMNRRTPRSLLLYPLVFLRAARLLRAFRPHAVLSTGAMAALPFCLLAKCFGARVLYLETAANVTSLSLTGRLVYGFADLFLVQWPALAARYPRARYAGRLL